MNNLLQDHFAQARHADTPEFFDSGYTFLQLLQRSACFLYLQEEVSRISAGANVPIHSRTVMSPVVIGSICFPATNRL